LFANVLRFHQNELVGLSFRFFRTLGLYLWRDKIQKFAVRDPRIPIPIHHAEQSLELPLSGHEPIIPQVEMQAVPRDKRLRGGCARETALTAAYSGMAASYTLLLIIVIVIGFLGLEIAKSYFG
jgi:hypothetical protein